MQFNDSVYIKIVIKQSVEVFYRFIKVIILDDLRFQRSATSSSGSHSSYSTLKILTTTLDCFNRMLYSTSMTESSTSDCASSCVRLLISLADNAHAMGKQLGLVCANNNNTCTQRGDQSESKKEQGAEQPENEDDDQEDYFCIYHMFYYKTTTFFSEVVYSLEPNENQKANEVSIRIVKKIGFKTFKKKN